MQSNSSIRYNPVTDYVEVLHSGEWKNFLIAGFDWDGLFYNYGNLCSTVTGGWTSGGVGGNVSHAADSLSFYAPWNSSETQNKNFYAITKSEKQLPKRFSKIKAIYSVAKITGTLQCSITLQICSASGTVLEQKTVNISGSVSNQTIEIQLAPTSNVYDTPAKIKIIFTSGDVANQLRYSFNAYIYKVWME